MTRRVGAALHVCDVSPHACLAAQLLIAELAAKSVFLLPALGNDAVVDFVFTSSAVDLNQITNVRPLALERHLRAC